MSIATVVLWGAEDEWLGVEDGQWLHRQSPNSDYVDRDTAGHFTPEAVPTAVAASTGEFVGQNTFDKS
jgi:pimeloyl-ACP methyl ester carboxylesterase